MALGLRLRLQIESNPARLALHTVMPRVQMVRKPPQVQIEQSLPQLEVRRTAPKLHIELPDGDLGLMPPGQLGAHYAARGQEQALVGIAKIAADGDALARIEDGVTVADVVRDEDVFGDLPPDAFNLGTYPSRPPVVTFVPGEQTIRFQPGELRVEAAVAPVRFSVQPGRVESRVAEMGRLSIRAVPTSGRLFDAWA